MLSFRKPTKDDLFQYFIWANDPSVREQSYNSDSIDLTSHENWFQFALNNENYSMFIFQNNMGEDIGQVRIQKQLCNGNVAVIGISVDVKFRGQGFASKMLLMSTDYFLVSNPGFFLSAYIKESNLISKLVFEKAGFKKLEIIDYKNFRSYHLIKK